MILHREQMDLIGSAARREQLRAEFPGAEIHLAEVAHDRHGFTVIVVEIHTPKEAENEP